MEISAKSIRNIFIYTAPKLAGYVLSLISLPILTRLLSPQDFGIIVMASLFPTVAAGVFSFGIGPAAQRFYFQYHNDKRNLGRLYFSCQLFLIVMFLLSSAGVFLIRHQVSSWFFRTPGYSQALFFSYLTAFLGQAVSFYTLLFQAKEDAMTYAWFTLAQAALITTANLVFVWAFHMRFMGLIYGSLLGTGLTVFLAAWHFNRGSGAIKFDIHILKETAAFGLQIVPKSFTGFINRFFDKYMLNNILSLAAVGVYNIGQNLGNTMFMLMNTVWSSIQPVCYKQVFDRGDEASVDTGRLFTIFAFMTMLPLVIFMLFAQELIMLIAPPAYYPAIDVVIIILLGIASNVFGMYIGVQYAYSKQPFWSFPITVAGTLVNVVANILLIRRFGLAGAAWSMVASFLVTNAVGVIIGQRLYRIKYEWPMLIALFSHTVVCVMVVLYCRQQSVAGPALYLIKLVLAGLFIFIGWRCRVITLAAFRKVILAFVGTARVRA